MFIFGFTLAKLAVKLLVYRVNKTLCFYFILIAVIFIVFCHVLLINKQILYLSLRFASLFIARKRERFRNSILTDT